MLLEFIEEQNIEENKKILENSELIEAHDCDVFKYDKI